MRLVLPAQAVLPVSGSSTPTFTVPLLPDCADAADGAAISSAAVTTASAWFFMVSSLWLLFSRLFRSALLVERCGKFLFRGPGDHRCIADRREEVARHVVAVARHHPGYANLLGTLRGVAQRARPDPQHAPIARRMVHRGGAAAAQDHIAVDRQDRRIGYDYGLGVTQAQQHIPAIVARHLLGDDALAFQDRDGLRAFCDALCGLDADHAAADDRDAGALGDEFRM